MVVPYRSVWQTISRMVFSKENPTPKSLGEVRSTLQVSAHAPPSAQPLFPAPLCFPPSFNFAIKIYFAAQVSPFHPTLIQASPCAPFPTLCI